MKHKLQKPPNAVFMLRRQVEDATSDELSRDYALAAT
jgi:hypothetical protein